METHPANDSLAVKGAEEVLRGLETRFRLLFDTAGESIAVSSLESGTVLAVNPAGAKLLGAADPKEICGKPAVDFYGDPEERESLWKELLETGSVTERLLTIRRLDGAHRFVLTNITLWRSEEEDTRYALSLAHDATERIRAENALRDSEKLYRTLVETSPEAIVLSDLEGNVLMANERAARMHGLASLKDLLDKDATTYDFVHPEDRHRAAESAAQLLEQGGIITAAYRLVRHDGRVFPAELNASVVRDADGEPRGFIGVVRDVTERVRAEEEIREKSDKLDGALKRLQEIETWMTESERMRSLGTLAGGVAHEFNNLLTGIMGCASFLQMHGDLDDEIKNNVEMILDASRQASELTRQLLGLVRKVKAQPRPFSLNETVSALGRMLEHTFPRSIRIRTRLAPDLPPAEGTHAQIHQALLNLCVNARDAMRQEGDLTLETARVGPGDDDLPRPVRPGAFVRVTVSDTGEGIPEENRDRVFEPFYTTKDSGQGTGLGLPLVKSIAEEHGGAVALHTAEGKGAAFSIFLPVVKPAPEPAPAQDAPRALPTGTAKLLLVDDEPISLMVLRNVLAHSGFEMHTADAGEKALEILRQREGDIDLVLLDMIMPGLSGRETFERIRKDHPGTKVVFLSGLRDEKAARELLEAGALDFILKPLDGRQILDVVRKALAAPGS